MLACERIALVTVPTVARRYAPRLSKGLTASGARVGRIVVPDGDATKNPRELARLWDRFLDLGLDRHSAVVTLGGGVVGDLGGFAAATFLRGIPFVQVPTTVLAMVDASIGGKTGINLARGKNLVGAFHQPRGVFIDIDTLRSLPRRERAAGAAELIKAAAIWDAELFAWLESEIEAFLDLEPSVVLHALERGCAIKAEVVARDEREGGLRRLLNFGHTLAHAIETHARYRGILHGEAVSIGMVFAAERSEALGLSPAGTRDRLAALLERAGLPTRAPDRPRRAYLSAIAVDKKKQGGNIHFVVLGHPQRRHGLARLERSCRRVGSPDRRLASGASVDAGWAQSRAGERGAWTLDADAPGAVGADRDGRARSSRRTSRSGHRRDRRARRVGGACGARWRIFRSEPARRPGASSRKDSIAGPPTSDWPRSSAAPVSATPMAPEAVPSAVPAARPAAAADLHDAIEVDELERAFAEAEAEVEAMHDVNSVAARVLMDEPFGLMELGADEPAAGGGVSLHDVEPIADLDLVPDVLPMDAAVVEESVHRRAAREEQAVGRGAERGPRADVIATLERWLGNLERRRARRAQ
ncbi:MAG: 3-dehydroquinate synthase [Myxococcota bacterium]